MFLKMKNSYFYSKITKNINYIKNDYPREIKCNEKNKRRI